MKDSAIPCISNRRYKSWDYKEMNLKFQRATLSHHAIIMNWLEAPHVKEFWDNSKEHREDVSIFIEGRIKPSPYYEGIYTYWIGSILEDSEWIPFSLIMTSPFEKWVGHSLSKKGKTVTLDFAIGNRDYIGRGLASKALEEFMQFYRTSIDCSVNTFFIDPDELNYKAIHVYKKAGFRQRGKHKITEGYFKGNTNLIMIKMFPPALIV